ncbi:hypothetical protein [Caballeronia sp. 15711]|uniref:hypothetical protein n=1 Tax=Caballeronia sp. 15711 TaxID=3391029 RepID=UPI0039E44E38
MLARQAGTTIRNDVREQHLEVGPVLQHGQSYRQRQLVTVEAGSAERQAREAGGIVRLLS